jgi:hypothetical protein
MCSMAALTLGVNSCFHEKGVVSMRSPPGRTTPWGPPMRARQAMGLDRRHSTFAMRIPSKVPMEGGRHSASPRANATRERSTSGGTCRNESDEPMPLGCDPRERGGVFISVKGPIGDGKRCPLSS